MFNKIYDKSKKFLKENFKDILFFIIIIFISTYQFPYYIDATGGMIDASKRVEVENAYETEGAFYMAYVNEMPATLPMMLVSLFNKNWDIIPEEDVVATTETRDEAEERGKIYLKSTISNATLYAYKQAKLDPIVSNERTVLLYKSNDSNTTLKIGDIIKKVNNVVVSSFEEIGTEIEKYSEGDTIDIEVENNGKIKKREATLNKEGKIGVILQQMFDVEVDPKIAFNFQTKESGPSGGLITTLTIYNYLTQKDITYGLKIAGTGTIEVDGTVGEIGGVKYKLAGVVKEDVDLFFVPAGDNYKEAMAEKEKNNYDIEIVGVSTFEEAVTYLETMTVKKK